MGLNPERVTPAGWRDNVTRSAFGSFPAVDATRMPPVPGCPQSNTLPYLYTRMSTPLDSHLIHGKAGANAFQLLLHNRHLHPADRDAVQAHLTTQGSTTNEPTALAPHPTLMPPWAVTLWAALATVTAGAIYLNSPSLGAYGLIAVMAAAAREQGRGHAHLHRLLWRSIVMGWCISSAIILFTSSFPV